MPENWHTGNAAEEGEAYRGWFIGHFISPKSIRATQAVEVKWGVHPAGQQRNSWHAGEDRMTSVVLLIQGRIRIDLSAGSVTLKRVGDYLIWGPSIDHFWEAEEDSVAVTVRWPSIAT
jgi:quercetin dioxygenase-like cupin family protein